MNPDEECCDRCDGCGWYEGGKTIQTSCEVCQGTGIVKRVPFVWPQPPPTPLEAFAMSKDHWLRKIESLRPGDACEFHYPARTEWRRGTVKVNGGHGYWEVVDEADQKIASGIYIEHVRLPGQTEAWPR